LAKIIGLSEASYIALHCMVLINEGKGEKVSVKEMAERLSVSEAHLAKVIQRLSRSGLIKTTRGPKGGEILAKQPEDISYLDIVESIEGPVEESGCVFGREECAYSCCIFQGFLAGITREARLWLDSHTLADFKETLTMNGGEHEKNNQD
jgi:Rrf2 family protein